MPSDTELFGRGVVAQWRYTDAAPDLTPILQPIQDKADAATTTANRTAGELQKWLAEQNAGASGGKAYAFEFPGTGPLTDGLIQDYQNGIQCKGGAAAVVWGYDTGRTRTFMALTSDVLDGDDQSAVIVVPGTLDIYNSGDGHGNGVVVCGNATASQGIVAWFYRDRIDLGHISRLDDGTATAVVWRSWTNVTIPQSSTLELRRTAYLFKMIVNGQVVAQHQTAPETIPAYTGPNYRRTGFTHHAGWGLVFAGFSRPVSSFSTSDISVPATRGTGWALSRTATGTENLRASSGWNLVPAYTFDMNERLANCELIGDYRAGGLLIKKTDWYTMSVGLRLNSTVGSGAATAGLFYAPVAGGAPGLLRQSADSVGSNQTYATGSFCEYLQAGSFIAPAIYTSAANKIAAGDAAGTRTWFTGFAAG